MKQRLCVSNILIQRVPCSTKELQYPQWNHIVTLLVNSNNNEINLTFIFRSKQDVALNEQKVMEQKHKIG